MAPSDKSTVLFIAAGPIAPATVDWTLQHFPSHDITFLALDSKQAREALPATWIWLTIADLGSLEELSSEYLQYLEAIPERPIGTCGTLNSLFRRRAGYSLWWTDVALRRSPTQGMFLKIKAVWMISRALARNKPTDVVIHTSIPRDAAVYFAAAKSVPRVRFAPGSALPATLPLVDRKRWYTESVRYLYEFIRYRFQRNRALAKEFPQAVVEDKQVAVLSTVFPRHVRMDGEVPTAWYWDHLTAQMSTALPSITVRYLLDLESADAWPLQFDFQYVLKDANKLAANPALVPRWRGHTKRFTWLKAWWHQYRMLRRYYRIERHPRFRTLFRFFDVDLSPEWIAELRHSISLAIWWESEVDAAASILKALGDVRIVLVNQEFELPGMLLIAACRRLGATCVGVQHGTFYPLHTIYTPPKAQIRNTPIADYLAVYGEYHKKVVSEQGHYPADRIWICAGSRFDALVNQPFDQRACRQRLGIPEGMFVVLITTQRYAWFPAAVRAVLATAPPNSLVCIKKFAEETIDYESLSAEVGRGNAQVYSDRFEDLLGACDVLLSGSSTTILEATLAGKPTVCLNFSSEPNYYPYVEEGVSLSARRADEMGPVLEQLHSFRPDDVWQRRRMKFLERHLGPSAAGKAGTEFAAKLGEIMSAPQAKTGPRATSP